MKKDAKILLNDWMRNMQDGDCVRVQGGEIIIHNWCGCEIAREYYK